MDGRMRDSENLHPEDVDPPELDISSSQGTPFFKSVEGIKSETEASDYQEGGVSGGTHPSDGTPARSGSAMRICLERL